MRLPDEKIAELNEAMRGQKDLAYLGEIHTELNLCSDIKRFIDEFMAVIANMNALTPDMHQDNDFRQLVDALDKLFAEDKKAGA